MAGPTPDDPRERWNARYRTSGAMPGQPAPFMSAIEPHLPRAGTAVDVGGGLGANARWLSQRGLTVTLLDASDEALSQAQSHADPSGPELEYLRWDVEMSGLPPHRRWDVVLMHLFLSRRVVAEIQHGLEEGGVFALCQPTVVNLEQHARPPERFLLQEGEVLAMASRMQREGWAEIIEASEGWRKSGRHDGWLVVRRISSDRSPVDQ